MDETRDELLGETRDELNETRDEVEASQEDELERVLTNEAAFPECAENDDGATNDDGGKDPSPLPCFALAANAEGGMINGDGPALARGAGEGSLDAYPAEGEALHREGLTLLECVLEGAPRCLSVCVGDEAFLLAGKGEDEAFLVADDLECC